MLRVRHEFFRNKIIFFINQKWHAAFAKKYLEKCSHVASTRLHCLPHCEVSSLRNAAPVGSELSQLQQRRGGADQQLRQRDQQLRQLQAEVDDLQQAIAAKDGQMAVMRVRLEEVDKQLQLKTDTLQQIEADRNRYSGKTGMRWGRDGGETGARWGRDGSEMGVRWE